MVFSKGDSKPANTAFKQQRLKAWQPLLTPKSALPTFFIVGLVFAPLGGILLYASDSISELVIDYTDCYEAGDSFRNVAEDRYSVAFPSGGSGGVSATVPQYKVETTKRDGLSNPNNEDTQKCTIKFTVPTAIKQPVYLYYRLENFYQNHRRYVKSFDSNQLSGDAVSIYNLKNGECSLLATVTEDDKEYAIYPCGLIANSIFNDTISDPVLMSSERSNNETYEFDSRGIAWKSEAGKFGKTKYNLDDIRPPPNWVSQYPGGKYTEEFPPPNPKEDEHLRVWLRTSALPTFRKLYGKNSTKDLKAGLYQIEIEMNYDVRDYGARKAIVISNVNALGGRNSFLGIAYIVVGCVCVLLGSIFTVRHIYRPRKLGDHTYLSWNQNRNQAGIM